MARRLPFLALSSHTLRRCPWRALLWSYAGATWTSKQGTPLKGKDALIWSSVPLLARIPSTERYQCRHRQGYHPLRGISAATGKDTIHREVSVLPQARIPSTERYQCRHWQGYHPQRGISATTSKDTSTEGINAISSKDASTEASVLSSNHLRARVFWLRTPVLHLNWTVSGWHPMWCPPGLSTIDSLYWRNPVTWQCICVHGVRARALGDSLLCTL